MSRAIKAVLIAAFSLIPSTSALQVTPGSSCASTCLDSTSGNAFDPAASTTNTSDIVCYDVDYYSTTAGVKFKDCLECLQTSTDVNGSESDVSWFIYNLRYASAVCLYDYPTHSENTTTTCDLTAACEPLQGAIETGLDLRSDSSAFGYCAVDDSVFYGTGIDDCVSCLQSSPDSYLANFLIALQAGCQQQPASGETLGLTGELFSGYPMNITSAASNSTAASTSSQKEVLSTGAIIGIVVGASALLIIAIFLFYIYWRKQQKYNTEDMVMVDPSVFYGKGPGSDSYMASMASSNSNKFAPIFTTDHKMPPPSYAPPGSRGYEMDYMNNADYYDRLEGKSRGRPLVATMSKQLHDMEINSANHVDVAALPTHPAYITRGHSRLGSRASRNSTPSVKSEPRYNKPDPYTIQMYMDSLDDANEPAQQAPAPAPQEPQADGIRRGVGIRRETSLRNIHVELAGPPEAHTPWPSVSDSLVAPRQGGRTTPIPQGGRTTPIPQGGRTTPVPQGGRTTPAPSSQGLGGRGTPVPAPARASSSLSYHNNNNNSDGGGGGAHRLSSLILPSVPRIRAPGKKPPRLTITSASPVEDISGPLAFPDSRFSRRAGDRIVEQTVDRSEAEVPIGSGKSYLYG